MRAKAVLIGVLCIVLCVSAMSVATENKGAKDITLTDISRGPVDFPHFRHQEALMDCNLCHKDFPQKAGVIAELKKKGDLKPKQIMNKQCIACHKEKRNAGIKTGPVSCSQCHAKK